MEIKYDAKGRVLSCSTKPGTASGGRVLHVAREELPDDFLTTFALDKYLVRDGKIVENKSYAPPALARLEAAPPQEKRAQENPAPRKAPKSKVARKRPRTAP